MLTDIYIENYTVVDKLQLTLHKGLTVLSGETGAGKSIIVDAIQLALGARGDTEAIRLGQDRCVITVIFNITSVPLAEQWLRQKHLDDGQECILSRTLQRDGRSRITVNGKPCPTTLVRELACLLLVVHGQHQSQTLLQRYKQQHYIDTLGHHEPWLNQLQENFSVWRSHQTELAQLKKNAGERDTRLALLHYQAEELMALDLQPGEWLLLHQEHQQLHNAKQLMDNLNQAIDATLENEQASSRRCIQEALDQLHAIHKNNSDLASIIELLNTAAIHVQEAGDELVHYREALDLSPERLQAIEQRLTRIHDLARKHHVDAETLPDVIKSIQHKINEFEKMEERIATLQQKSAALLLSYQEIAQTLSLSRKQVSQEISKKITAAMQTLGMEGGEFAVAFETEEAPITPHGREKLVFMVKTNPGQPSQPLHKIVSGGELSRLSLLLQTLNLEQEPAASLIFDEVDVGIGGKTAERVGALLKKIAEHAQVFCITHLPQVAAQGDHHYLVSKTATQNNTLVSITPLDPKARVDEIARMLSGSKITQKTLQHAAELLN